MEDVGLLLWLLELWCRRRLRQTDCCLLRSTNFLGLSGLILLALIVVDSALLCGRLLSWYLSILLLRHECWICAASHLRKHLDVLVCTRELFLQVLHLLPQFDDQLRFWINVLGGLVLDVGCFHGIVESAEVLLDEGI